MTDPLSKARGLAGVTAALLVFELLLRLLTHGRTVVDPVRGLIPQGAVRLFLIEGGAVSHWDRLGTRVGPPVSGHPPVVLVLGDSFVEAMHVADDVVFSAQLQRRLAAARIPVRMINAGRGGQSPADYVKLAAHYERLFRPAWVIVELNQADLEGDSVDPAKTHFRLVAGRVEVITTPSRMGRISALLSIGRSHCALLDVGLTTYGRYASSSRLPPLFHAGDRPRAAGGVDPHFIPVDREMKALRDAWSGRITFLFTPSFADRQPTAAENRMFDWCRANRVSCVNLRTSFAGFRSAGNAPTGFPDSAFGTGHWNEDGHAAVARLLQTEMEGLHARGLF